MNFPDQLTVLVSDAESGEPIGNIAVILRLFATRKNDYYVGPHLTGRNGEVIFTREDCEFAIGRSKQMFLMDYHDDLGGCRPLVEIGVHPHARIAVMIQQYRDNPSFWGSGFKDPDGLFAALQLAKNVNYLETTITLREEDLFSLPRVLLSAPKRGDR